MSHQITISDAAYQHLAEHAATSGMTIEALATAALDVHIISRPPAIDRSDRERLALAGDAWTRAFDALTALIRSRADRYPPGFQLDVSREAMYDGCGE